MQMDWQEVYGHELHSILLRSSCFPWSCSYEKKIGILHFIYKDDCNSCGRSWFLKVPLLVLLTYFLCWWFLSQLIMIITNSFLGAINTFLALMVFSLVGHDRDVHELGLVDAILVFIVFCLVSREHDVHKLFSWC